MLAFAAAVTGEACGEACAQQRSQQVEAIGAMGVEADVPVIDIAPLISWGAAWGFRPDVNVSAIASQIIAAGRPGSAGFFTMIGHGVDLEEIQAAAAELFALPDEQKLEMAPRAYNANSTHQFRGYTPARANGKELFDSTNPAFATGRAPLRAAHTLSADEAKLRALLEEPSACRAERTPRLCATIDRHWGRMQGLGQLLLRAVALGLNEASGRSAAEADLAFFDRALAAAPPMSCLRFNLYPLFDREALAASGSNSHREGLACEAHRDMSVLTLLDQGSVGGLQILQRGSWKEVPLTPGALVVNIGGALQRMTNDALVATAHRVRFVDARRVSIPFFLEGGGAPGVDSPMDCLAATVTPERPCNYTRTTYGPYIHGTFAHFQEYASRQAA